MHNSVENRYVLKLPDALHRIDPDFTETWLLPFFTEGGCLVLPRSADLSPLAGYVPTGLDALEQQFPAFFRTGHLRPDLENLTPLAQAEHDCLLRSAGQKEEYAVARLTEAYFHTILSVAADYSSGESSLIALLETALQGFYTALDTYLPGYYGGFRGYALWHIRCAVIRFLWDAHPENLHRGSGKLMPEYRLRENVSPVCIPPEAPIPHIAVSASPLACKYRELKQQDPQAFCAVMERMSSRETEVLELLLQENGQLTIYDAADLFGISPRRIGQILAKLARRMTQHRRRNYRDFLL